MPRNLPAGSTANGTLFVRRDDQIVSRSHSLVDLVDNSAAYYFECPVAGGQRLRVDLHQGHRLERAHENPEPLSPAASTAALASGVIRRVANRSIS